jgi:hypothetical protein
MFKKLIGIWVLVLIVGAVSLGNRHSPQAQPQRTTITMAQQSPKTTASVICNEADWDCRKEVAAHQEVRQVVAAAAEQRRLQAAAAEEERQSRIAAVQAAQIRLQMAADEAERNAQAATAAIRQQSQVKPTHSYSSYWYSWTSAPRRTCNPYSPRCNY